jgi:hypothetical protein
MRLILITAVILGITASIFASIRMWGENQTFKAFESAYFAPRENEKLPLIVVPWEQNFFLEQNPNWILWADVYRGEANQVLVKPWAEKDRFKKELIGTPGPTRPLLLDLLNKFPRTRFVVNCNDNVENIHLQIMQIISEAGAKDRVLFQSDYANILVSAKEVNPMMVFGSSMADLTRLKTYDSLFLLPASNFNSDVFFSPIVYRNRETITTDIAKEIHRRMKRIFLGPLTTKDEVLKALSFDADGLFLADPTIAPL